MSFYRGAHNQVQPVLSPRPGVPERNITSAPGVKTPEQLAGLKWPPEENSKKSANEISIILLLTYCKLQNRMLACEQDFICTRVLVFEMQPVLCTYVKCIFVS